MNVWQLIWTPPSVGCETNRKQIEDNWAKCCDIVLKHFAFFLIEELQNQFHCALSCDDLKNVHQYSFLLHTLSLIVILSREIFIFSLISDIITFLKKLKLIIESVCVCYLHLLWFLFFFQKKYKETIVPHVSAIHNEIYRYSPCLALLPNEKLCGIAKAWHTTGHYGSRSGSHEGPPLPFGIHGFVVSSIKELLNIVRTDYLTLTKTLSFFRLCFDSFVWIFQSSNVFTASGAESWKNIQFIASRTSIEISWRTKITINKVDTPLFHLFKIFHKRPSSENVEMQSCRLWKMYRTTSNFLSISWRSFQFTW